jgi:penicillin-binding protein 2
VSLPGYDPNQFVEGIDPESYRQLLGSPDRPLFNRALTGQYPPGSTIKPFLGLAGLGHNVEQASKTVYCPGWYSLKGSSHRYRDWKKNGHGRMDLTDAIVQSCDVFFYELAYDIGIDRMSRFLMEFGFGRPTGIDLRGEAEGLVPSSEWKRRARNQPWYPGETLITGIGQGFILSTPLQLAAATATIGMRGLHFTPSVVRSVQDQGREPQLRRVEAKVADVVAGSSEHWQKVIDAMVAVVHSPRGTANRVGIGSTYRFAGKTGTAQVFTVGQDEKYDAKDLDKKLHDHGLFIAFAPPDHPRIALAVIVENAGGGSRTAAPIARIVMDHYLRRSRPQEKSLLLTSVTPPDPSASFVGPRP